MGREDAARWNQRYESAPQDWYAAPRSFLVRHLDLLPRRGLALDLAMGPGQNAALLIDHGLDVLGVDISFAGVLQARRRAPRLMAVVADLEHFDLPEQHFDVILNFYYLQRALLSRFSRLLKPGGIIVVETLTTLMLRDRPDIETHFLLQPGELFSLFQGWEILFASEGWQRSDHGHEKAVASLIARLPVGNQ